MARRDRRRQPGRGVSLTTRILAVNVIALGLMAFSLLYLDSYRNQILAERFKRAASTAEVVAGALGPAAAWQRRDLLIHVGDSQHLRLRLYDAEGHLVEDSFALSRRGPSFVLTDPSEEGFLAASARLLDRAMDGIVGAAKVPRYYEAAVDTAAQWPEITEMLQTEQTAVALRYAPDRTPIITAAAALPAPDLAGAQSDTLTGANGTLLMLSNDRDVTQQVRDARQTLALVVAVSLLITVLLSLFLARTIVQPLRILVRAAVRVRLGRDRAVVVPRLPERRDEIGLLARALSDMTGALRQRMDAVESFAADVAHEIKNPLASLRSALESLEKVDDRDLRRQLSDIANHDVQRIDRLVTEIAEASRIDAELSRATLDEVDLGALAIALVGERNRRGANGDCRLRVDLRGSDRPVVAGDAARLERVLENLIDNAVSFSPPGGVVELRLNVEYGVVVAEVLDQGPGIAPAAREKVFERFHSLRPSGEDFGGHSGLGLAIARTIIEAHDGTLTAREPAEGHGGARLVIELPAVDPR